MRILTLNPPFLPNFSRASRSPEVTKGGCLYYPYWLAYATGVLEKEGFDVKLIDGVAADWGMHDVMKFVDKFKPDLTVISTSTPSIFNDIDYGVKIKKRTGSFVTLVGTHVTALPGEALKRKGIDSVARGEYDYTIRDLVYTLKSGRPLKKIKGLSFKQKRKIIHNPNRPLIKDLDEIPFASKVYERHLDIKRYFYPTVQHPEVTILTSRGCKFQCAFCLYANIFWKGTYRFRSAKNVADELEYIENNLDVKEVMFEDATFSAAYTKDRVREICKEIIKRKIEIGWVANSRADVDYETLNLMKKAGCRELCVGFESAEQAVLNGIPKGLVLRQSRKFMEAANNAGIVVHGCFILGLPGETKETVEKTIDFALELDPETIQVFPMMVYPGTPAFKWAEKNGFLRTKDWSKWIKNDGTHNCMIIRPELTSKYLVEKCDEALKKFYLRRGKIIELIFSLKSLSDLERFYRGFKVFIKYLHEKR